METTIDVPVSNGSAWYRCCSRRGVLNRRNRRYRGRLSAMIWFGVLEGPDRSNSLLLRNLRLAYICRRRLTCLLAMDRRGTVAVVEEVGRCLVLSMCSIISKTPVFKRYRLSSAFHSNHFFSCSSL